MNTKIIAIVGAHTSGKSEVVSYLTQKGYVGYTEIAQELIDSGVRLAMNAGEDNQKLIMQKEFDRDRELIQNDSPIFVETWHIGNLAHCKEISEELYGNYFNKFKSYALSNEVYHLVLGVNPGNISKRTKLHNGGEKSEAIGFHEKIGLNIVNILEELSLPYEVIDANRPLEEVKRNVMTRLEKIIT